MIQPPLEGPFRPRAQTRARFVLRPFVTATLSVLLSAGALAAWTLL
jgi:hypothetical protein